ncbi:hypothetical protein [Yoonia sp.]|uniref:hypothetical protein n=1 Tax=Yoonia sp. TaxID=2212373 RepID=UPI002FDB81C4
MFKRTKVAVASLAALVAAGSVAQAGGLSDQIMEAPVVQDPVEVAPAAGSIPGWVIPLAIIGLMVGIASSGDSDGKKKSKRKNLSSD